MISVLVVLAAGARCKRCHRVGDARLVELVWLLGQWTSPEFLVFRVLSMLCSIQKTSRSAKYDRCHG